MTGTRTSAPHAAWLEDAAYDPVASLGRLLDRRRARGDARRLLLPNEDGRRFDELIRGADDAAAGSDALRILRAMFARGEDYAVLDGIRATLRAASADVGGRGQFHERAAPDLFRFAELGLVGQAVDVGRRVEHFLGELLESEAADDGRAVGGDAGDLKPHAKERPLADFDVDEGSLTDAGGSARGRVDDAVNDLDARTAPVGEAPSESAFGGIEWHLTSSLVVLQPAIGDRVAGAVISCPRDERPGASA